MRLFVYGTLCRGESNHHLLAGERFVGRARTEPRFRLVEMGGFPAMVAGGTTAIEGELYEVSSNTLERVDELEDHPSFYRRTQLRLADGRRALLYLLPGELAEGRPVIASGRWSG